MKKKLISLFLVLALAVSALSACGGKSPDEPDNKPTNNPSDNTDVSDNDS